MDRLPRTRWILLAALLASASGLVAPLRASRRSAPRKASEGPALDITEQIPELEARLASADGGDVAAIGEELSSLRLSAEMSVLSANAAFYDAFTSSDVRKMQDVWAAGDDVSCVHPGHPVIAGSAAVVNSWRALFSTGTEMPALRATRQKVVIRGNVAWVTCQETTGDEPSSLEAINVFERRDGKWLMCHHHASPVFV